MLAAILTSVFVAACGYGVTFPFLAGRLEEWGVSGVLIGLNAAMPALGWFLGSFLLPVMQSRTSIRAILVGSLVGAGVAWVAFAVVADYWAWTPIRFVFGGAIGLFFRSIEFGLNAVTADAHRGRVFGWYSLAFGAGLAVGAALEPLVSADRMLPWIVPPAFFVAAVPVAAMWRGDRRAASERPTFSGWVATLREAPVPMVAGLVYGFGEAVPAYLLSIYALRNGFGAEVAAHTLSAAALGSITLPLALGVLADRGGRRGSLVAAAGLAAVTAAAIPFASGAVAAFLGLVTATSGFSSAIYAIALALIGERWPAQGLNTANAAFGASYALGGLIGPLVNGAAIDTLSSQGLMVSAAVAPALLAIYVVAAGGSAFAAKGETHEHRF